MACMRHCRCPAFDNKMLHKVHHLLPEIRILTILFVLPRSYRTQRRKSRHCARTGAPAEPGPCRKGRQFGRTGAPSESGRRRKGKHSTWTGARSEGPPETIRAEKKILGPKFGQKGAKMGQK